MRADHPLARKRKVGWRELAALRWVMPEEVPQELAGPIYRALERDDSSLGPTVQTNSVPFMKRLLATSDAVGLLPEGAVADEREDGVLTGLELPGIDPEDVVGAVYRRDLADLPLLAAMIAALREELRGAGLLSP